VASGGVKIGTATRASEDPELMEETRAALFSVTDVPNLIPFLVLFRMGKKMWEFY